MESIQVISVDEFWKKHLSETRKIIREEIQKNLPNTNSEEILLIDDVCTLLGKSRQTIFLWMEKNILVGRYINDSLFFKRSEILELLEKGKNKSKRKQNSISE